MKRFIKILSIALAALMLLPLTSCRPKPAKAPERTDYNGLFDVNSVHKIEVSLSDEDWADLKANPLSKTKYHASVTIDGSTVEDVSFATKGNTSLTQVAASDSDRYSFKINFGKYVKGQTYYGLNKLDLNNLMADATYMKDYISYEIMRRAGVAAPFVSYAELYVNGRKHGLYIAIESVSDPFLERTLGSSEGALYKPETDEMGGGGMAPPEGGAQPGGQGFPGGEGGSGFTPPEGFDPSSGFPGGSGFTPPEGFDPSSGFDPSTGFPDSQGGSGFPVGQGMPGSGDSGGADLVYIDDDVSSYPAIFDNEENDVTVEDEQALIAALKALSTGEEIVKYWNTDQIVRYFAAHNFVLNYDSYTGSMLHNYFLYELEGRVTVLPWDYNLAFCGFMGGSDATEAVNTPIDDPLSAASAEARPLWNTIVTDEALLAAYHSCYDELLKSFFESGECEAEIERVRALIAPYVKDDPSAFCTADEFNAAVDTLIKFCDLRAESIRKQLDGGLSSTKAGRTDSSALVSASGLDISSMGSFMNGSQGGPGGMTPPNGQGGMAPPNGQGGMAPPNGQGGMTPPNGMTPPDGQGRMNPPDGMTPPEGANP